MLATVLTRAQFGMEAPLVTVDVHVSSGLPSISIVGLPETAVKEGKDRVRSAITTAGYELPAGRITINLAPANLPKDGGRYDLPIAVGLLAASRQIPTQRLTAIEFYGELSLGGKLRPVGGILPAACEATAASHRIIVPPENLAESHLVDNVRAAAAATLLQVCAHLRDTTPLSFNKPNPLRTTRFDAHPDLADVRGQTQARRAVEIAAAGGHSLLLTGPPGTGKTLLATRFPGILPPMSPAEALETAAIASVSTKGFHPTDWNRRPFRAPHHTASPVALAGGGSPPKPGEISLAHNGVLFLDELPEFDRHALEILREPLETGTIAISRAAHQTQFPARFQIIAAMNPCPCGYLGDTTHRCRCTDAAIHRYRSRISGPLLDRLDLHVTLQRVSANDLAAEAAGEPSSIVAARVARARAVQIARQHIHNARLEPAAIARHCALENEARAILERATQRFSLSARAYHRLLKVARTIADLDASGVITPVHISEALLFRQLDGC